MSNTATCDSHPLLIVGQKIMTKVRGRKTSKKLNVGKSIPFTLNKSL